MPSMKCYQCGKVRRCKLHIDESVKLNLDKPMIVYLCAPCARELGR